MLEPASAYVPVDAQCQACGYSLRELNEHRCPECGRMFDPENPRTMDLGRPESGALLSALRPLGRTWHRSIIALIAATWWGMAWLPGGYFVTFFAAVGILALALWGLVRSSLRQLLLLRYPRMRRSGIAYHRTPWFVRVLLLATLSAWVVNPAQITFMLTKFLFAEKVRHAYEEEPLLSNSLHPGWYGPFFVEHVQILPSGVHMHVFGADEIVFDDQGLRLQMFRPWPFIQMSDRLGIWPQLYR